MRRFYSLITVLLAGLWLAVATVDACASLGAKANGPLVNDNLPAETVPDADREAALACNSWNIRRDVVREAVRPPAVCEQHWTSPADGAPDERPAGRAAVEVLSLACSWQFQQRAVAPPRAPARLS